MRATKIVLLMAFTVLILLFNVSLIGAGGAPHSVIVYFCADDGSCGYSPYDFETGLLTSPAAGAAANPGADITLNPQNKVIAGANNGKFTALTSSRPATSCYDIFNTNPTAYVGSTTFSGVDGAEYFSCVRTGATGANLFLLFGITRSNPGPSSGDESFTLRDGGADVGPQCADFDGDGYGAPNTNLIVCNGNSGSNIDSHGTTDCDDLNSDKFPGNPEICDGLDNDCDATTIDGSGEAAPIANKRSGVCAGATQVCSSGAWQEPDYTTVSSYEATEVSCDSLDNNCDGTADENLKSVFFLDMDGDGYGLGIPVLACSQPEGYVANSDDCDDTPSTGFSVNPAAIDICNNINDDCSVATADGSGETPPSADKRFGVCGNSKKVCSGGAWQEPDYTTIQGYEAVENTCDTRNNDCDFTIDEGCDSDQDGFLDGQMQCVGAGLCKNDDASREVQCSDCSQLDCDDNSVSTYPGSPELCDGVDNDCNSQVDESGVCNDVNNCGTFGNACPALRNTVVACVGGTCALGACEQNYWNLDDAEANGCEYSCTPSSGGVEACDGLDNDCDGAYDETFDVDSDFYSTCGTDTRTGTQVVADCDDNNNQIHDGALELLWDGVDNDCDGLVDAAIEILQPLAGVRWTLGTIQTIEWLARNINNVELTYTTEPNAPCEGESPQSDGSTCDVGPWKCIQEHGVVDSASSWTVPQIISDTVRIRVEGHDDTHRVVTNACSPAFTVGPACGNGQLDIQEGEQCDDGNLDNTDSCTISCLNARCGDGYLQPANGEQCDDDNAASGDGCSSACQIEVACTPAWQCSEWSACVAEGTQTRACTDVNDCGIDEGRLPEEQSCTYAACTTDTDCTPLENGVTTCADGTCVIDCNAGYELQNDACIATPQEVCGDSILNGVEQCDGSNLNNKNCINYVDGSIFTSGTLSCKTDCTFDTSACTSVQECVKTSGQEDAETSCEDELDNDCDLTIDSLDTDCQPATPECGNNVKGGTDECDGTDFGGKICSNFIAESAGLLACTPGCRVDTDKCKVSVEQAFDSFEAGTEVAGTANGLFTKYSFTPKARIVQPKIKIETLQAKPAEVSELQGAYKYAAIETTNFDDSNIENVRLQFVVEKSWLLDNELDKKKVKLQRYELDAWVAYESEIISDGSTAIVYESTTPGLSTFAVTADKIFQPAKRPAKAAEAAAPTPSGGGGFDIRATYKASPLKQIVAAPVVGNGKCESGENSQNACSDCGCGSPAYDCTSNSCILKSELEAGKLPEDRTPKNIIEQSAKFRVPQEAMLAVVLAITGTLGYAFYRTYVKPKIELPNIAEAHDATEAGEIDNAKSFIAHAMAEGYHVTDLKEYLLQAGWPPHIVEQAIKENSSDMLELQGMAVEGSVEYPGDDTSYLKKYVKDGRAKGYTDAQIRAIVVANGWPEDIVDKVVK